MNLFTLDQGFQRWEVIDDFSSIIWTERYGKSGDVNLVVPLTTENVAKLHEDTLLSLNGTNEVMLIDTVFIKEGTIKLTGKTLDAFLAERIIRSSPQHEDRYWNIDGTPGVLMGQIVHDMCIQSIYIADASYGLDGPREVIPNLALGSIDTSGDSISMAVPFGPIYPVIEQLAGTYSLGFSLYLDYATSDGYGLKFKVYKGRDLTSSQNSYPVVRFSPSMDSLANVTELRSKAGYKTVAYAFAPADPLHVMAPPNTPGTAFVDDQAELAAGFNRRVLMIFCEDITTDMVGGSTVTLRQMLDQRAADALANNNYIRVVDGEVIPTVFEFGADYLLGDIVELQSISGLTSKARITEYIRSKDSTGERAYPTVSIIE